MAMELPQSLDAHVVHHSPMCLLQPTTCMHPVRSWTRALCAWYTYGTRLIGLYIHVFYIYMWWYAHSGIYIHVVVCPTGDDHGGRPTSGPAAGCTRSCT